MNATQYVLMKPTGPDPFAVLSMTGEILWSSQPGIDTMLVAPTAKALALRCLPITGKYVSGTPDVGKLCAEARESGVITLKQLLRRTKRADIEPSRVLKRKSAPHGRVNLEAATAAAAVIKRRVTPEVLAKVAEFRSQGVTWREAALAVKLPEATLKSAARRQASIAT